MYKSFILPHFDYCDVIWDNIPKILSGKLEHFQLDCLRTISGCVRSVSHDELYYETGFDPLSERRRRHKLALFYEIVNKLAPPYLTALVPQRNVQNLTPNLRNPRKLQQPLCRTETYKRSFIPSSIGIWNELPNNVTELPTLGSFKAALNAHDSKVPSCFI